MTTRFMFIRNSKGHPVGCVAYRLIQGSLPSGPRGAIEFEVSTHNPVDPFDRSLGRFVAEGRMNRHPKRLKVTLREPLYDAMIYLLHDPEVPERLKRAIKRNHLSQFEG